MWRILKLSHQYAAIIILLTAALTYYLGMQIPNIKIKVSSDELIPAGSELQKQYDKVRAVFGSDEVAVLYVQDSNLFDYNRLDRLKSLNKELGSLESVERVESLFTVSNIKGEGGWIDTAPLLTSIPRQPQTLAAKKESALYNPLLLRNVISKDGSATSLTLYLNSPEKVKEKEKEISEEFFAPIIKAIDEYHTAKAEAGKPINPMPTIKAIQQTLTELKDKHPHMARGVFGQIKKILTVAIRPPARGAAAKSNDPIPVATEIEKKLEALKKDHAQTDSEVFKKVDKAIEETRALFKPDPNKPDPTPFTRILDLIQQYREGDPKFADRAYSDIEKIIAPYKLYNEIIEVIEPYKDKPIHAEIEKAIAPHRIFDRLFQVGSPAIQVQMTDYILNDQKVLLPLSCLVLAVLIGIMMRSILSAFIPILNALLSAAWTFGVMALLDVPVNMLNYIVPALILVIGATEDVHLLVDYREALAKKLKGMEAIIEVGHKIGLTLALTGLTTVLGFAATGLTDIKIMRDFGITAALGMFSRFIVSVIFLPAFLRYFGRFIKPSSASDHNNHGGRLTEAFTQMVMTKIVPHPIKSCGVFLLISICCAYFATNIKLSNDFLSFLKEDSPLVQELDTVAENLSGTKVIYLTLYKQEDEFKEAKSIKTLSDISNYLRDLDRFDTVISLADYLALVNQEMHDGDKSKFMTPRSDDLVAQYLLFFHHSDIEPYVSADYSKANIVIRCNINDSHELNLLTQSIRDKLDEGSFGLVNYTLTGKSVMVSESVDQLATGQTASISFMAFTLFVIIAILFISIKAASLTVVANLFAVIALFGIMGFFGIPLNVGTCMVAAITIGIGIDDTLHLMVRYNKELKVHKDESAGIANAIRAEFVPVLVTSLGLAGGFLVLGTSSFVPVMQFGLLSAFVIFLAVVADLILTPLLLSTTRLITIWDLVGLHLRKQLMTNSPVFKGMNTMQAKKLILASQVEHYAKGSEVIRAGEEGDAFYVVLDGELEVSIDQAGDKIIVSYLAMGEAFGEIALISRMKRTATVTAKSDTKLLVYDWESLVRLRRFAPYLSSQLLLNLANILGMRLVEAQKKLDADDSQPLKPLSPLKRSRDKL